MRRESPIISVINPNSNEAVTRGLEEALSCLSFKEGPRIACSTLAEGPFGIETQADADDVVAPLRRLVEKDNASSAFVIACYSDPGLHSCGRRPHAPSSASPNAPCSPRSRAPSVSA